MFLALTDFPSHYVCDILMWKALICVCVYLAHSPAERLSCFICRSGRTVLSVTVCHR